jgi:hypothetical protein
MSDESIRRAAEEAAGAAEEAGTAAQNAAEAVRKVLEEPGGSGGGSDENAPTPSGGARDTAPFAPTRGTDKTGELGLGEGSL